MTTFEHESGLTVSSEKKLAFEKTDMSFSSWQEKAREKLFDLLGLGSFKKCEPMFRMEWEKDCEAYKEMRFSYQSEDGYFVPSHFLYPLNVKKKPPVIICLQGHSTGMHISLGVAKYDGDVPVIEGDRDFALQAVEQGMCAVVIEQRCFGEKSREVSTDCHAPSLIAIMQGRTIIGGRVWDIMRLIDVLENEFSDICDVNRVYCMGNSGGGTSTIYAAALESRIKAAMPSCAYCTFYDSIIKLRHCECNYVPGILEYFDMAELCGMIAPRPLVVVSGEKDNIFPIEHAKAEFKRLKEVYYYHSASPENCVHVIGGEGHKFYKEQGWKAFNKLV